jgi:hypothetical protein
MPAVINNDDDKPDKCNSNSNINKEDSLNVLLDENNKSNENEHDDNNDTAKKRILLAVVDENPSSFSNNNNNNNNNANNDEVKRSVPLCSCPPLYGMYKDLKARIPLYINDWKIPTSKKSLFIILNATIVSF